MRISGTTLEEDKIREIMQDFMFNEKLYAEIVSTTMLTCVEVGSESQLLGGVEDVFDLIFELMALGHMNVSDACVANSVTYGTDKDNTQGVLVLKRMLL